MVCRIPLQKAQKEREGRREDFNFSVTGVVPLGMSVNMLLLKMRRSFFIAEAEELHTMQLFFSVYMCLFITSGCLHSIAEYVLCSKVSSFSPVNKLKTKTRITVNL